MRRTWTYVSRFGREEELARRRHSDQDGKEDEQKRRGEVQDPAKTASLGYQVTTHRLSLKRLELETYHAIK
jgi:hypothetical protein